MLGKTISEVWAVCGSSPRATGPTQTPKRHPEPHLNYHSLLFHLYRSVYSIILKYNYILIFIEKLWTKMWKVYLFFNRIMLINKPIYLKATITLIFNFISIALYGATREITSTASVLIEIIEIKLIEICVTP